MEEAKINSAGCTIVCACICLHCCERLKLSPCNVCSLSDVSMARSARGIEWVKRGSDGYAKNKWKVSDVKSNCDWWVEKSERKFLLVVVVEIWLGLLRFCKREEVRRHVIREGAEDDITGVNGLRWWEHVILMNVDDDCRFEETPKGWDGDKLTRSTHESTIESTHDAPIPRKDKMC